MAFTAPTTPLPPGYSWAPYGSGDHTQVNRPVIVDPSGRKLTLNVNPDALWTQYNNATGGSSSGQGFAPGTPLTMQQLSNLGTAQQYQGIADNSLLTSLEKEYADTPNLLRSEYGNRARAAGTYGDTKEFKVGLESDVKAGAKGARFGLTNRINALRKALGKEEFTPGPDEIADPGADIAHKFGEETGGDNTQASDTDESEGFQGVDSTNAVFGVLGKPVSATGTVDPYSAALKRLSGKMSMF